MKLQVEATSAMGIRQEFTIAGVYEVDKRNRWRRLLDWLARRKPTPVLKVFRVTGEVTS